MGWHRRSVWSSLDVIRVWAGPRPQVLGAGTRHAADLALPFGGGTCGGPREVGGKEPGACPGWGAQVLGMVSSQVTSGSSWIMEHGIF